MDDVRGVGLMWGLLVYPGSGCADGTAGDLVMLGPPFTVTEAQIDEIVALLKQAVQAVY